MDKTTHYKIYVQGQEVYEGGTFLDCWKYLVHTGGYLTIKELIDDGVEIKAVERN